MPEAFRQDPIFKDFKDWDSVFKSHKNAVQKIGVPADQLLRLNPDGTLPVEGYRKLGVPETYVFPADVKNAPAFSDQRKQELTAYAKANNLTANQFNELVYAEDKYSIAGQQAREQAEQASRAAADKALKDALGEAYNQDMAMAKNALDTLNAGTLWNSFDKAGLTTNPQLINFLSEIGKLTGDDAIVNGTTSQIFKLTPNGASAEINAKRADASFMQAYLKPDHPNHAQAVMDMTKLFQQAFPG